MLTRARWREKREIKIWSKKTKTEAVALGSEHEQHAEVPLGGPHTRDDCKMRSREVGPLVETCEGERERKKERKGCSV